MTHSQLHVLLFKKRLILFSVFECLHTCMCTMCAWYTWSPEEAIGPMELEVQVTVSHCVGSGSQTRCSGRTTGALHFWSILPTPKLHVGKWGERRRWEKANESNWTLGKTFINSITDRSLINKTSEDCSLKAPLEWGFLHWEEAGLVHRRSVCSTWWLSDGFLLLGSRRFGCLWVVTGEGCRGWKWPVSSLKEHLQGLGSN